MNKELAKAMIDKGKSSADVAAEAGIHAVNFSKILRGRHAPSLKAALRIAKALELPVEQIFGG